MKEKLICAKCMDYVAYDVLEKRETAELKGREYSYYATKAVCKICGEELFEPELHDRNLKKLYDVYRAENDLVLVAEIEQIISKYSIAKRPLSNLLGWGEHTVSRYLDGDMPSKAYSTILRKIHDEPEYYLTFLDDNKDKINESAYLKSREAVLEELNLNLSKNDSKINIVIKYILSKNLDITPLALQKILYYVQGWHYAFKEKYIFSENCLAWQHGPVYDDIYYKYKQYGYEPIENIYTDEEISEFNNLLEQSEMDIIDAVVDNFSCYGGKTLEEFTHLEKPWIMAHDGYDIDERCSEIIEKESIGEYFTLIKNNYGMTQLSDISKYSKDMFEKICKTKN